MNQDAAPQTAQNPLDRVRIVLVSPSHPGNVGSTARAMQTMGLSRLAIVAPRYADVLQQPEAIALAAGCTDVLNAASIHATLDEALQGVSWAAAMTARGRDIGPPHTEPRAASLQALALSAGGADTAFVFGSERYGLDNDDVLRCQVRCTVPTSAHSSSLNLAQAVQIVAYECRIASLDALPSTLNAGEPLATHEQREQLFAHLQEALIAVDFLDPTHPKKLMYRIRRMFARTGLEHDEVSILRGICTAILTPRR